MSKQLEQQLEEIKARPIKPTPSMLQLKETNPKEYTKLKKYIRKMQKRKW